MYEDASPQTAVVTVGSEPIMKARQSVLFLAVSERAARRASVRVLPASHCDGTRQNTQMAMSRELSSIEGRFSLEPCFLAHSHVSALKISLLRAVEISQLNSLSFTHIVHNCIHVATLALHQGERGFDSQRGSLPCFHTWESYRAMSLVGGFPRGSSAYSRPGIPTLLHFHLALPSSALKTFLLRAVQAWPLYYKCVRFKKCEETANGLLTRALYADIPCWIVRSSLGWSRDLSCNNALIAVRRIAGTRLEPAAMGGGGGGRCSNHSASCLPRYKVGIPFLLRCAKWADKLLLAVRVKGLAYLEILSKFEAEQREDDKDDCTIAAKCEALHWRAVFSLYFVSLRDFLRRPYHFSGGNVCPFEPGRAEGSGGYVRSCTPFLALTPGYPVGVRPRCRLRLRHDGNLPCRRLAKLAGGCGLEDVAKEVRRGEAVYLVHCS
ncbi:hypothetical protein PR048_025416 [Dryococelus australis]|uniref:Uncharacterized protein n=1 Tax=Dryococelus australis TaxID=614101 RepID=A0ABQ9GRB9_9NEOP|nr:hypothetical protein PR048_025416 [Dryococelus australis]